MPPMFRFSRMLFVQAVEDAAGGAEHVVAIIVAGRTTAWRRSAYVPLCHRAPLFSKFTAAVA